MSHSIHPSLVHQPSPRPEVAPPAPEPPFLRYLRVHKDIQGWFGLESAAIWDSLLSLQSENGLQGHMLEIGVHHGKAAALLALHAKPQVESCVLVDKFLAEARVRESLSRTGRAVDDSIQLLRLDSRKLAVAPLIAAGFGEFRWVHIDGEHTAQAVRSDLAIAHALLSDTGIVCVDDFFSWWYPQITEAVLRYVRENPDHFQMFLGGYNKAYLARPQFMGPLLEYCDKRAVPDLEARGVHSMVTKTTWPSEMNCFGIVPRYEGATHRGPDWDQKAIHY